jgi:hypothetical protein
MIDIPPAGEPRRDSYEIFLPRGLPVLRSSIEELLKSRWDEPFRQRALEIACAFEGSLRVCGQPDAAAVARTLTLLLQIEPAEAVMLGKHLDRKFQELLGRLESLLGKGEVETG